MSSYTMQLRTLIEQPTQYETGLSAREKIEIGRTQLFDFDYPIFDVAYKKTFETNFIRKFYMREIGFETDGLFKFQLETWLLINMPYFNKMFESELIEFDPLVNSSVDVTHNKIGNKIQNDVVDGTKNSIGNETKNSIENQTSTATGQSDSLGSEISNVVENQTSSTTGQSDSTGSSDTVASETTSDTSTGSKTEDNFERDLKTNNPDTRLAITTNDGEGVIEYASSIEEETVNNSESTTNNSDGNRNTTSGTDTTDSATTSSSLTADSTGDSSVNRTDANTTSSSGTIDSTGDTTLDRTVNDTTKDTLSSNINDVEDFIQHRAGKIGIQTYSEMVMKYRTSFLRIENEIHNEMQELFMLVY